MENTGTGASSSFAVPAGASEIYFGRGYDSVTCTIKNQAVEYDDQDPNALGTSISGTGQQQTLLFTHVTSSEQLRTVLNLSASASFGLGMFGQGEASASYYRESSFSRYSELLVAHLEVINQAKFLKKLHVTKEAHDQANRGPKAFSDFAGDNFLVGMTTGGRFIVIFEVTSSTEAEQTAARAAFHAASGSNNLSASVSSDLSKFQEQGKMTLNVILQGPAEKLPSFDPVSFQKAISEFPPKVALGSGGEVVITAHLKSYDGLITQKGDPQQIQFITKLSAYFAFLNRRKNGLEYIQKNPGSFGGVDVLRLKKDISEVVEEIEKVDQSARDCALEHKCIQINFKKFDELPPRLNWINVNPASGVPTFVGETADNEIKFVEVRGFWSPWITSPPPQYRPEWYGPGDETGLFRQRLVVTDKTTGASKEINPTGAIRIEPNSVVRLNIITPKPWESRSSADDPLKVAMYNPLY
jgi:hypothetical protein